MARNKDRYAYATTGDRAGRYENLMPNPDYKPAVEPEKPEEQVMTISDPSNFNLKPPEKDNIFEKAAKFVLPKGAEQYFGLTEKDELSAGDRIKKNEDLNQSYFRQQRKAENISNVETPQAKYVAPTTTGGRWADAVKNFGYIPDVYTGYIEPAVGTVAEIAGTQTGSPKLREWGEQFTDTSMEQHRRSASGQSMVDTPGVFEGGLKDPRFYSKTISQTTGFLASILGTSIAVTAVTKNPLAGVSAGYAVGTMLEGSGAYQEMIDAGVAPDNAAVAGTVYGVLATMIENATGIKPAGGSDQLIKDFAAEAGKNAAVKKFFRKWVEEGVLEEGSQQLVQNLVTKFVDENQEVFDGVAESMVTGLIASGPMVGGSTYLANRNKKQEDVESNQGVQTEPQNFTTSGDTFTSSDEQAPAGQSWMVPVDQNEIGKSQNYIDENTAMQAKGEIGTYTMNHVKKDPKTGEWTEKQKEHSEFRHKPFAGVEEDLLRRIQIGGGANLGKEDLMRLGEALVKNGYANDSTGLIVKAYAGNDVILGTTKGEQMSTHYIVAGINKDTGKLETVRFHATPISNDQILGRTRLSIAEMSEESPIGITDGNTSSDSETSREFVPGPGWKKVAAKFDGWVRQGHMNAEDAVVLKNLFEDANDDYLASLNLSVNGRLSRSLGRFNFKTKVDPNWDRSTWNGKMKDVPRIFDPARADEHKLELQKNLPGKGNDAARVFLHEYGHSNWFMTLSDSERAMVDREYKRLGKQGSKRVFKGGLDVNPNYHASNIKEFFAEMFAEYVLENKVPAKYMEPMLKRLATRFYTAMKRLVNRGEVDAVNRLKPIFEKALAGDKNIITDLVEGEPPSFKQELQAMFADDTGEPTPNKKIDLKVDKPFGSIDGVKQPAQPTQSPLFPGAPPEVKRPTPSPIQPSPVQPVVPPTDPASVPPVEGAEPLEKVLEGEKKTPPRKKVSILDWIRTPAKVMRKLGVYTEYRALITSYEKYIKELPGNMDKIAEWANRVSPESNERIFDFLDGVDGIVLTPQEQQVADEVKSWLGLWADRLGMKQDERISNYITHIFPLGKDGAIPEEIATLIDGKVAKSIYNPFQLQRKGAKGFKRDTWAALEAYVKRSTRKANIDPALEEFNEASKHLTEKSQSKYIEKRISTLNMRPTYVEEGVDNFIHTALPNVAPRPSLRATSWIRRVISRAKIGGSVVTFAKNLTQGINTWAELGNKYTMRGYRDIVKFGDKELVENGVLRDSFYEDKKYDAIKKWAEKFDKKLFINMEASELVNRGGAYYGAKAKFLDGKITPKEYNLAFDKKMPNNYVPTEAEAIQYGKHVAEKTQFLFGPLETPQIMSGPFAKTAMQFQTFAMKQSEFGLQMLSDKEYAKLSRYLIGSSMLFHFIGSAFGMEWDESFKTFRWGYPPVVTFIGDLWKQGVFGEDSYGNKLDAGERVSGVANSLFTNVVPAGAQMKRTFQGISAVNAGKSETKGGTKQYDIDQTPMNYIRAGLFGKGTLPQAQEYYQEKEDKKNKKKTPSKSREGRY